MRDDIANVQFAKYLGFQSLCVDPLIRSKRNHFRLSDCSPANSLVFEKGDVRVWQVKGGWRFADYSGNFVTNHSPITSDLSECLESAARYHLLTNGNIGS
ncbi:hypothetical protein A1QO_02775 [Vibrio genomosp. F10 str. ZF-129]|uniref:Uncharacterized protein n=1 Tax=Vibrio genomosp. F10 str. ZF-129 TaxID=1187848 RepID=A0A1E5BLJ6_9VIBR|nr:hypothetical protein [Vibrio genomosp. F10]OEE38320.1 hypothetical protein A1QO_02775 [Vibrio genomosp. F10 str. ZF-129]